MRQGPPWVRTLFQFVCAVCGREEWVRFPFNPLQPTPDLIQSVPDGWTLSIGGSSSQTPTTHCGCL